MTIIDDASFSNNNATLKASSLFGLLNKIKKNFNHKRYETSPELQAVSSAVVFQDIIDHFGNELGPDGEWRPWSPEYTKAMRAKGKGGNNILQDTGRLRQSFVPGGISVGSKVGRGSIIWFNNTKSDDGFPYAWYHDEGAKNTRSFMWLSDKALDKIGQIFLDLSV